MMQEKAEFALTSETLLVSWWVALTQDIDDSLVTEPVGNRLSPKVKAGNHRTGATLTAPVLSLLRSSVPLMSRV